MRVGTKLGLGFGVIIFLTFLVVSVSYLISSTISKPYVLVVTSFMTILLGLLVYVTVTRSLAQFVKKMTQITEKIHQGDLNIAAEPELLEETGVLGELASALNLMIGALFRAEKECKELNSTLERRVEHRTEELKSLNRELKNREERLELLALLDPLTELLNRRGLQQALLREIIWSKRSGTDLMAILIDLDDFKLINDKFGHAVGDVALKEVAQSIKESLRSTDYVSRIGGDEFIVLLPNTRSSEGLRVAEKIRVAISRRKIGVGSNHLLLSASLGFVDVPLETILVEEILSRAHLALRQSKVSGKNRVCSLDGVTLVQENSFESIFSLDSLYSVRQPIFRLSDLAVTAYEFLSRSTIKNFQMPVDFFRVSMAYNMLAMVDYRCFSKCLETACCGNAGLRKHINLFPSTMLALDTAIILKPVLESGCAENLCIEISEDFVPSEASLLLEHIKQLKAAGIKIALDNVGFGRSSLEALIILEPDIVKIDKKLTIGVSKDAGQRRSLTQLLKLLGALRVEVIAEGIETEEDLEVLKSLGILYGQGYLWGKSEIVEEKGS